MNKNFSFVKASINPMTPRDIINVLEYEVGGDMNKIVHNMTLYPALRNVYLVELKKASAQAISMLRMMCEVQGWDFEELMTFGEQDYLDKMKDIRSTQRKVGI